MCSPNQIQLSLLLALQLSQALATNQALLQFITYLGINYAHYCYGQNVLKDHRYNRVDSAPVSERPGLNAKVN